jgi:hypothetical protein
MIEQGIVQLILADATVASLSPNGGGFYVQLPKGQSLPSWTWQLVSNQSETGLQGEHSLGMDRIQVDVYGDPNSNGVDCLTLAEAIDRSISGVGSLSLTAGEVTYLCCVIQSNTQDFFDSASRSFRRMLEYEVWSN